MNRTGAILTLGLALALGACGSLPDIDRGEQAMERGDWAEAERNLRPLAERGYLMAQVRLARAYRDQGDPESLELAAQWFRKAMRRDASYATDLAQVQMKRQQPETLAEAEDLLVEADLLGDSRALKLLIRLYRDNPQMDTQDQARQLLSKAALREDRDSKAAVIRWYREHGQSHAHREQLFQRCLDAKDWLPKCYIDLAEIYRAGAAWSELDQLLEEVVARHGDQWVSDEIVMRVASAMLDDESPADPQPSAAAKLLERVQAQSPEAKAELAELLLDYPELSAELAEPLEPVALLEQAAEAGSADAALELGRAYLRGRHGVTADPRRALKLFQQAAQTLPAAHYSLGRMYQRGQLGESHPELALQHLLLAARAGYARADLELAKLYSRAQGVRPEPVTAASFAHLAGLNGIAEGEQLKRQIQSHMSPQQQAEAQALAQREFAVRQSQFKESDQPADAEFAAMEDAS